VIATTLSVFVNNPSEDLAAELPPIRNTRVAVKRGRIGSHITFSASSKPLSQYPRSGNWHAQKLVAVSMEIFRRPHKPVNRVPIGTAENF